MSSFWESPLHRVVGDKSAKALARLGLHTVADLMSHHPRRYQDRGRLTDLAALRLGDHVTVMARVLDVSLRPMSKRQGVVLNATIWDGRSRLALTFFGKHAGSLHGIRSRLLPGETGLFTGTVSSYQGNRQLTHPDFEMLDEGADEAEAIERRMRPEPIYPASTALPSWKIRDAAAVVLSSLRPQEVPDLVPSSTREREHLYSAHEMLEKLHRPQNDDEWRRARRTAQFEEAFLLQTVLARRRHAAALQRTTPRPRRADGLLAAFDQRLPFSLTAGQLEVGEQLAADLASQQPMQRLLQGEVGSGKTVVALRAMLQVVDAGGQAALLAPTEVLAAQHLRSISALLGDLGAGGTLAAAEGATRVELLTSALPAARRAKALAAIASGEAGIVVGTHALLADQVQFADLGLLVVDEQHKFGVEQRDTLRTRGETIAHSLVMTATPIPRTVAMTVFGDLEVSSLTDLPAGRPEVTTYLVPRGKELWMDRVWARCGEEIVAGGRVYVVCPRIDANDAGEDSPALPAPQQEEAPAARATVLQTADELASLPALGGAAVTRLHGRMSADAKERAMADFASGRTPVLVTTTVVEVGVDVPEASVMVILDADRFGLSQLHQLRGRIGRGDRPGICFAVSAVKEGSAFDRLAAFAASRDGFALAEEDLQLRREGDVLGASQSGLASSLTHLRVLKDRELISRAREHAERLVALDPDIHSFPDLRAAAAAIEASAAADFIERS